MQGASNGSGSGISGNLNGRFGVLKGLGLLSATMSKAARAISSIQINCLGAVGDL